MGFIFGGDTEWTYEQLQNKKKIADQLREGALTTPRNVGEGLAAIGKALGARGIDKRAGKREGELRSEFDSQFASLFGGSPPQQQSAPIGGGVSPAVGSSPISQGPIYTPADNPQGLDQSIVDSVNAANAPDPALDLIRGFEGFRETPYWDVNALRTGYGSDTITMADGTVKRVTEGDRVTREMAELDLQRRVNEEFKPIAAQAVGQERWASMPPNQQAALTSIAYNYGEIPSRLNGAIASGDPQAVAQAITALGRDNNGINADRRAKEAAMFLGGGGGQPVMSAQNSPMQAAPAPVQGGGPDMQQIMALMSNPMATPAQKAYLGALMQQQMAAQAPADPMDAIELEMAQLELERARNPQADPGYTMLTPDQVASIPGLDPNRAYQAGPDGKISAIGGGGVTVNTGSTGPAMGTIPQGYTAIEDPSVEAGYRLVPIPGGPEDTTEEDANAQAGKATAASIVSEDINLALGILESNPTWTSGFGAVLRNLPGTEAKTLDGLLGTIKANTTFDRLQAMRDSSPTGGALGAINAAELDMLGAAMGNLDQSLGAEDLKRNLERINRLYLEIIHGPGGGAQAPQALEWDIETGTWK